VMHNSQANETVLYFSHNRTGDCHRDGKNASCISEIGRKQGLESSDRPYLIFFSRSGIGLQTDLIFSSQGPQD